MKVPLLLGDNSEEGSGFVGFGLNTDVHNTLTAIGLNDTLAELPMQSYPINSSILTPTQLPDSELNSTLGLQNKRITTLFTDLIMKGPRRLTARLWLQNAPHSRIHTSNSNCSFSVGPQFLGASHGFELPYVFYNINGTGYNRYNNCQAQPPWLGGIPFDCRPQTFIELAKAMSGMWIGFVVHLVPSYSERK